MRMKLRWYFQAQQFQVSLSGPQRPQMRRAGLEGLDLGGLDLGGLALEGLDWAEPDECSSDRAAGSAHRHTSWWKMSIPR